LEDETEVTDVSAFFKELKLPADISAYKADVPKALHMSLAGFMAKIKAVP
jgi:hypothetical protein